MTGRRGVPCQLEEVTLFIGILYLYSDEDSKSAMCQA